MSIEYRSTGSPPYLPTGTSPLDTNAIRDMRSCDLRESFYVAHSIVVIRKAARIFCVWVKSRPICAGLDAALGGLFTQLIYDLKYKSDLKVIIGQVLYNYTIPV